MSDQQPADSQNPPYPQAQNGEGGVQTGAPAQPEPVVGAAANQHSMDEVLMAAIEAEQAVAEAVAATADTVAKASG